MCRRQGSIVVVLAAMLVAAGTPGCAKTSSPPDFGDPDAIDDTGEGELPPTGLRVTITNPATDFTNPVSGKLQLGVLVEDTEKSAVTLVVDVLKAGAFGAITRKLPGAQADTIEVDTSLVPDGRKWTLRVVATTDDGRDATATVQMTVDNSGPGITPKAPTPIDGASILGDLKVRFLVKDAGAGVATIEIVVKEKVGDTIVYQYNWPPAGTNPGAVQVDTGELLIQTGTWTGGDKTLTVTATDGLSDHEGTATISFSYSQRPRFQGGSVYALPADFLGNAVAGIRLGLLEENSNAVVVAASSGLSIFTRDGDNEVLVKRSDLLKTACASVTVRDMDADGLMDIVAVCSPATGTGTNVHLFLQTANSAFAKPVTVLVPATVEALALGDLNTDGHLDVALALSNTTQTVGIILSNANAQTWGPLKLYGGAQSPKFIAIGQFGDRIGDGPARENAVLVAQSGSANATLFQTSADGVLSAGLNSSLANGPYPLTRIQAVTAFAMGPSNPPNTLAFADGERDQVVLVRADPSAISPRLIEISESVLVSGVLPSRILAGDLNGDGTNDLAVLCKGGNQVHLFEGKGTQPLQAGPSYLVGSTLDMTFADLDDDGNLDVVALSQDGKSLTWLQNLKETGNLVFSGAPMVGLDTTPISMAVGRFTRPLATDKTLLDVAILGTGTNKNIISFFTAEAATGMAVTPADNSITVDVSSPRKLLAANVNPNAAGDVGLDDLVVGSAFTGPATGARVTGKVYLFRPDGLSHTKIAADAIDNDWGDSPNLLALGNFSGRAAPEVWRPDMVAIATFTSASTPPVRSLQVKPFINQGTGTFTTKLGGLTTQGRDVDTARTPRELVAAPLRFPLDSWLFSEPGQRVPYDVLSPDGTTGDFTVYASDQVAGTLVTKNRFKHFAVGANPRILAVGFLGVPVDGSHPADLAAKVFPDVVTLLDQDVVISYNSSDPLVTSNPDLLTFEPPVSLGHTGHGPSDLALADMNNDGNIDILVLNAQDSTVSVYLNLGIRTFSAPYVFATGVNPQEMAVANLDGAGCPDIVTVDTTGKTLTFLKNVIPCGQ